MLYIRKIQTPTFLQIFARREASRKRREGYAPERCFPAYGDLQTPTKNQLKDVLFAEQRGLCCYCMQKIDRSRCGIEHFLPQSIFRESEVDYFNLYLTCKPEDECNVANIHCDVVKGNELIVKLLGYAHNGRNCEDLFRYNRQGEILPFGQYTTITDCYQNYVRLNALQRGVLLTIDVLNLNESSLKDKREKFITNFMNFLVGTGNNRTHLEQIRTRYDTEELAFAGVALYFLKQKLQNIS